MPNEKISDSDVILHIGTSNCRSSALQRSLCQNNTFFDNSKSTTFQYYVREKSKAEIANQLQGIE
jgi:hypothetical protein